MLFNSIKTNAQDTSFYEIPFTLNKQLLVFKGKLNNIDTDFAFDTGASIGVSNTKNEENNGVVKQNKEIIAEDARQNTIKLTTALTKKLSIGGFDFENVVSSFIDMELLHCMNLYLLGSNIINQLNWEIDFNTKMLRVSKNPFRTNSSMKSFKVYYKSNIPRVSININGKNYTDVIVDFGYNGSIEIPKLNKKLSKILLNKYEKNEVEKKLSSAFVLGGLSNSYLEEIVCLDSLNLGDNSYKNVLVGFMENTDFKIGLKFFLNNANKVIINNSTGTYHLETRANPLTASSFPMSVILKDDKFIVNSVRLYSDPNANLFKMNEELKSINGKIPNDFKNRCDYLNWYYTSNLQKLIIEKLDGNKIELQKISFFKKTSLNN